MKKYIPNKIELKWRKVWNKTKLYKTPKAGKHKCYVLDMFPYPSGEGLHVGHPKGYVATDVYSRMKRMQGYSVLHPMGWDAFGLPAENYALKMKTNPRVSVKKNVARYKKQIESLGFNYDWSREVNTTDPNFYKWTQWIFREMFNRGLAYESNEPINWCPSCKTGLANEDVEDGKCERCGTLVEKKPMRQWVLKITNYADRLLADLDALEWPEHIKQSQREWIGRSEGAEIKFDVKNSADWITVFTTRPDTLFGVTYVVVSPESKFLEIHKSEIANFAEVQEYIKKATTITEIERTAETREKTGVKLEGISVRHPLTDEELPVWVADYVLAGYGTGAVMAVPAHDTRDMAFAKKYNLPIKDVIGSDASEVDKGIAFVGEGTMINSPEFSGMGSEHGRKAIVQKLEAQRKGSARVMYKLKDWVFARQRYWGEPIPLVYCEACAAEVKKFTAGASVHEVANHGGFTRGELMNPGWIAVPEKSLPVELPNVKSYEPSGTGESPLATMPKWVATTCPKCKGPARRETNTMPQWAGSSWYYLRYLDPKNKKVLVDKKLERQWMPVDMYVGGTEHATRHLIYARFYHKFLFDIGVVSTKEPFTRLANLGQVLGDDGRKMSKRWGNVVNPDDVVKTYGADTLRLYEMFMGPFENSIAWSTESMIGCRRFLDRVWRLGERIKNNESRIKEENIDAEFETLVHKTIKKVGEDIENFKFNTAISSMMILVNEFEKQTVISDSLFIILIRLLAPFAPHMTEELWHELGQRKSVHEAKWPQYDEAKCVSDTYTIALQVNGKLRGTLELTGDVTEKEALGYAKRDANTARFLEGKEIVRCVVIQRRVINVVVKP